MQYRRRINYSAQQKELMWERWKHGVYISYTQRTHYYGWITAMIILRVLTS